MNQLFRLLDNWSKSCGMATMIVDAEGRGISEDFGMTEFCRMVQSCEKGRKCCMETWKLDLEGVYECPFGFWDFSIPIVLPDGQMLGKVLAGQALSNRQKDEELLEKTSQLGFDEKNCPGGSFPRAQEKRERNAGSLCPSERDASLLY